MLCVRLVIRPETRDPFPERQLREKFRTTIVNRPGGLNVDMMASDTRAGARTEKCRLPSDSAMEGSIPEGKTWWSPLLDLTCLVFGRVARSRSVGWSGIASCSAFEPAARRSPEFRYFRGASFPEGCGAFFGQSAWRSGPCPSRFAGHLDRGQTG